MIRAGARPPLPIILLALLTPLAIPQTRAEPPSIPPPEDARIEEIGERIRLNGVPIRMQRVLSTHPVEEIAAHYRHRLGAERAESRLADSHILSQEKNGHFITVRIRSLTPGITETLVSVSDMQAARRRFTPTAGIRLPADSSVLSDMEADDAGTHSRHLLATNGHSIEANLQAISAELAARGYRPDGPAPSPRGAVQLRYFTGDRREARLLVTRRERQTHIELTTILKP